MYCQLPNADLRTELEWARACQKPSFIRSPVRRGARRQGEIYEGKVHKHLSEKHEGQYTARQWFIYQLRNELKPRFCQTDGLLFNAATGTLVVCEVKLRHTSDAFFQLDRLYQPVLAKAFPQFKIACLEITRWYDPAIPFPVVPQLVPNELQAPVNAFGVRILKL